MESLDYEKAHEEYVLSCATKDRKINEMLYNHSKLCSYLEKRLKGITVLAGPENLPNSEPATASKLKDYQLIKIIWLMDALEMNKDFRASVGKEMNIDYVDKESAHGGVIVLEDNVLKIRLIPGRSLPPDIIDGNKNYRNYLYNPVDFNRSKTSLFLFHFHAFEEDNSKFASPTNSDLKEAERRKIDGILFTKIMGNRFNTDFFSVGRDDNNRPFQIVLDLGLYEY
ncbi:MAG: hypothetical protein ABIG39_07270 [Candidatus Micrarchaeota archaeon]